MRILLTDSRSPLSAVLQKALTPNHDVRLLAPSEDARALDTAARAAQDCDVIVHAVNDSSSQATPGEALDHATRATFNLITQAQPGSRFILLSSLQIFEQYDVSWNVNEAWAPRPTPALQDIAPYLAELTAREASRALQITAIGLRLGDVVDDTTMRTRPADPRWLHLDDAVQAIERAIAFEPSHNEPRSGWWVFHIPGGGRRTRFPLAEAGGERFGYTPHHDVTSGESLPRASRPGDPGFTAPHSRSDTARRNVVIFGAGGPLGTSAATALEHDHVLRLADIRSIADIIAENRPPLPGAPLPHLLDAPHEMLVVDVTDFDQVRSAMRGMDAVINCSVVRSDPVQAFRVNILGAWNVMRAAVQCGIRRVVHTGPRGVQTTTPANYRYDVDLSDDVPARPGVHRYFMTKYLGQEICRVFAEAFDLEVPALLFSHHVNPDASLFIPPGQYGLTVSYHDSGQAMRQAVGVPSLPRPFEILHITTDLPNGRYRNEKAKQLLSWEPQDSLEHRWRRPD